MEKNFMAAAKPVMKMPELLVFARYLAIGFLGAEVWRVAYYLGSNFAPKLSDVDIWLSTAVMLAFVLLCHVYATKRGAIAAVVRMGCSARVDLLIVVGIGIWANELASPWFEKVHAALRSSDPHWAPSVFIFLCAVLVSPLAQLYLTRSRNAPSQLYFIADDEIRDGEEDLFACESQAKWFAETVLASDAHKGLVFGVDGPWGVGKTSFINLAERYWEFNSDKVIVCRFEPLRYASEPDLTVRLIRDVTAAIQRKVFAPEFHPAASRYSRLIRGKADVSFLGFKLSMEPSQDTVDELLDDIDEVLRRIGCRVIIVIDDLDRLDAKATNNVLFAARQTFKIRHATYVLCYDTENLARGSSEYAKAREFIEKFVTIKLSLFVDSSSIQNFLRKDWQSTENQFATIPSDTMIRLGSVLNELADILGEEIASKYVPLVGDLRKVKRFVNAMLLMQIDKNDLGRTDFNKRDLINLMLLHLNYPGLFRRIYSEETEGRCGSFSVRREYEDGRFKFMNSPGFEGLFEGKEETADFLLRQLFDLQTLNISESSELNEAVLASRACFNQENFRNLEEYLKLIVRFTTPEPQRTFVLYSNAVGQVQNGALISSVLESSDFRLQQGEYSHDQFWRVLVSQSHLFNREVAEDAIDTLIKYLPRYSVLSSDSRGLRSISIYSLLRLLDCVGWGRSSGKRLANTSENVMEIAWRIFGERSYEGRGILHRLASCDRGVIGWNDLMLFRLQCSADRQGQLYNLQRALIVNQDSNAKTDGLVRDLALMGMRRLSQEVFSIFKRTYIDQGRNFYKEVEIFPDGAFLGDAPWQFSQEPLIDPPSEQSAAQLVKCLSAARTTIKSFVIYQLSNSLPPNGSGVGCGYYDETGVGDGGGIAKLMNAYVFETCFNPNVEEDNAFLFLDHCLSHLIHPFFSTHDESDYFASTTQLPGGLDPKEMGRYWNRHRDQIRRRVSDGKERFVVTSNYVASYREHLAGVFSALDTLADEALSGEATGGGGGLSSAVARRPFGATQ